MAKSSRDYFIRLNSYPFSGFPLFGNDPGGPLTRPGLRPVRPLDGQGRSMLLDSAKVLPSNKNSPSVFGNTLAEWRGTMCHCCVSSSPGCFVPAPVGLVGNRELWDPFWIPACAGMTDKTPSPGGAKGTAGLSHQGRGGLLHSAKMLRFLEHCNIFAERRHPWRDLLVRSDTLGVSGLECPWVGVTSTLLYSAKMLRISNCK